VAKGGKSATLAVGNLIVSAREIRYLTMSAVPAELAGEDMDA
jgi:hypothetical protein